jgi:hypothetical protein
MSFDISRLRRSDQIVGGSAIAFFIFLFFFHWYGYSSNGASVDGVNVGGASFSANGWHSFTNSRWIWLITIIVALVAVAVASGALKFESPVQLSVVVTGLGALSTLLILYRIVHHPTASASFGSFHVSVGIKIGIWLGLIAAAGITYGGYLGMQAEDTSLGDLHEQPGQAPGGATASVSSTSEGSASAAAPADDAPTPAPAPTSAPASGAPAPASPAVPPIPPPVAPPPSSDA